MKTLRFVIMCLLLTAILVVSLSAQTLPVDSRKKEMQFFRDWSAQRYSPAADTLWHKITLPDRCMEVWAIADSGSIAISPDSLYYTSTNKPYAWIQPGVPFKLPTYRKSFIWVKRASSAVSTHLNLIFKRM